MIKEKVEEWKETSNSSELKKFVKNPKKSLIDFIRKSDIKDLIPFQADSGTHYSSNQIRISKEDYESLKQETQDILKKYSTPPIDTNGVYKDKPKEKELYEKTWYWANCDAYMFDYGLEAFWIQYRGKWGYEGMEDGLVIEFIKCDQYPALITRNLNCSEGKQANKRFRENL